MKVFELADNGIKESHGWLEDLNADIAFPICNVWECGTIDDGGCISMNSDSTTGFDVLLITGIQKVLSERCWHAKYDKIVSLVDNCRIVISHKTTTAQEYLHSANFNVMDAGSDVLLAVRVTKNLGPFAGQDAFILYHRPSTLIDKLISGLRKVLGQAIGASDVKSVAISDIEECRLHENSICISLIEAEVEFLATMSEDDMSRLRHVTNTVTNLLWVTTTNMLSPGQGNPNLTLRLAGGTTACEFAGIITATASDVGHFNHGDRVVVLWPNKFNTTERVPAWAVQKLLPHEDYATMATIPVVYSTALYALHDRANIKQGESILVHAGSGALGIAVIGVAKNVGAVVYATVGSEVKKDFLVAELGLPASHIFSSRDTSFSDRVLELTGGRGVDIIINSLTGDLMHASWENCLAEFGRFVEVGKKELVDAGRLNMRGFLRGSTFTAFDLEDLILSENQSHRQLVVNKAHQAIELYRARAIQLPPIRIFDVSEIGQACRYFSTRGRVGKVVISLERPESLIRISKPKYSTILDSRKAYFLVGCLGGLGRSLSRWMMMRGARHFVFLGRSGCAKPGAKKLVSALREAGAHVSVVTGDVADRDAVDRAIMACKAGGKTIGGVVQAAMGLSEAIFSQMTNEAWHVGVRCKWAGTWNLHNALEFHAESPAFFLMTSSIMGSVGVATEANYCASNGFLDAFARWRRSQGQPAVSIGLGMISEVGYLHENPDIEAILVRRGVQAIPENEFLQLIDLGLSQDLSFSRREKQDEDTVTGHILSGLESVGFRKLLAQGFDVTNLPLQDPRSRRVAESLAAEQRELAATGQETGHFGRGGTETDIISAIRDESDSGSAHAMILQLVRGQLANLILIPADRIDKSSLLSQFGLDSMLAAEFRTWFWSTFRIDIPFLDILGSKNSLKSLACLVQDHITSSLPNGGCV
ncbi:hypothetical protein ONZ43_g1666 [Nemania bipapillata]|uniref:Uncharacterized protein n=1 Tax=Nemania bipapillata TaxID=110536 RepID=A0ACC2J3Y6_9PEZI|nr:hypothetical protein ONZ43_g1666 [Nemania bipapillata]